MHPNGATVSIGVTSTGDSPSYSSAFRDADEALYRAKGLGRNRVVCGGRPPLWAARSRPGEPKRGPLRFIQPALDALMGQPALLN